jgi:hypothetical protein
MEAVKTFPIAAVWSVGRCLTARSVFHRIIARLYFPVMHVVNCHSQPKTTGVQAVAGSRVPRGRKKGAWRYEE